MSVYSARENIITALLNEIPEYLPCCPDISNMIPSKMTGRPFWDIYLKKDPPLGIAQVHAVNQLGIDGFSDQGKLDPSTNIKQKTKEKIIRDQRERGYIDTKTVFKTSRGELAFITRYYSNQPPVVIEKPIKDLTRDLPKLAEYFDPSEISNYGVEYYTSIKEKMGDKGLVCLNVPVPGLHWLHEHLEGGLNRAVRAYYEEIESVKETCKLLHEYLIEYVKKGLTINVDAIQLGASGLLHFQSPRMIRELSLDTMREIALLARSHRIPCHLHACGNERALVKIVAEKTAITSVEPLEMPPLGDCELAEIKKTFGKRLGLKGNIHTIKTMLFGNPKDVETAVKCCIENAAYEGGYILSTGDQCPAETPVENIQAMVKATQKFG
ncbi:MAG: uroporphyrinogen decarboxylase family protein [Candidatus Hodarchaeales archaeon]|jgi:uroporphyrinogen decarboxylase